MECQWTDQFGQCVVIRVMGEDRSHNIDHSYYADGPEEVTNHTESFFHDLPSLSAHSPDQEPQGQDCRRAVKQVARDGFDIARLAADNFRHDVDNSGKRQQPGKNRADPPPHSDLLMGEKISIVYC